MLPGGYQCVLNVLFWSITLQLFLIDFLKIIVGFFSHVFSAFLKYILGIYFCVVIMNKPFTYYILTDYN